MKIIQDGNDDGYYEEEIVEPPSEKVEPPSEKPLEIPIPKPNGDNSMTIFLVVIIILVVAIIAYLNNKDDDK